MFRLSITSAITPIAGPTNEYGSRVTASTNAICGAEVCRSGENNK